MTIEQINNSFILYDENYLYYVREYYLYCVSLIKSILDQYNINIIVGGYDHNFNNNNKTYKINIQFEHTLVKPGGRDSGGAPTGVIPVNNSQNYLVRIDNYYYMNSFNGIIEYSIPNIINITKSNLYNDYINKNIYISPLLYDNFNYNKERSKNIITTFINVNEPRRKTFLDMSLQKGINVSNESGNFSKEQIFNLYSNSKILINIHQTPHHDTFEELRVLSTLLCGCIVISEDVPLRENIPYHKHIIWSNYDNIIDVMQDVSNNYEHYYDLCFKDIDKTIKKLKELNIKNIKILIEKMMN